MHGMTLTAIAAACGGKLVGIDLGKEAQGAVIDSRLVEKDYLFFAVPGERVDGHSFIAQVATKGALGVVCEREPEQVDKDFPYILVNNTLEALKLVAMYYRSLLDIPVVGITGSVGKTSTKECVASVLETKYKVLKTQGNFNNEIGVPLTILRIRPEHQVAVLEMGINHFGEMHRLSEMAKPDICLFTNIGQCHLEFLGSRDGILKAKTEMFDFMAENGSVCVNGDDDKLITIELVKGKRPVRFGLSEQNDVFATDCVNKGLFGSRFQMHLYDSTFSVEVPLPGSHAIYNALAAGAVGHLLGLTGEQIAEGIGKVQSVGGRSHIIGLADKTIIDDCYNANPVSMEAALELLATANSRKVAILGDMIELGENELALHRRVGAFAANKAIDLILCVGTLSQSMYEEAIAQGAQAKYYNTKEVLLEELPKLLKKGDTILLKASHGMGFSSMIDTMKELQLQ